ncbi:MAG: cyclic-di-AMP receptor [Clostridia bacterium]|nr:cyclic-di-AMP receptor [Clostridia bacterium]
MKLIIAIVNNDDAHLVNTSLTGAGYQITKISSTGGFLMNGNSTFLIGADDDKVDDVLHVIGEHCRRRTQAIPVTMPGNTNIFGTSSTKVSVGGATVFIIDIEKFIKF